MSKPQQPELHRSSLSPTDPASTKTHLTAEQRGADDPSNQIPPDNQPGHHPENEQDKPDLSQVSPSTAEEGTPGHA